MGDVMYCCSIDIGKKNFSLCVEAFNKRELLELENVPENNRYNSDGTPTEAMEDLLNQVYANGKIVLHENVDLTKNCDPKKKLDPISFYNMNDVLDKYAEYWDKCETIIIEEQMSFGKKMNKMAMKLGQHCYSYFTIKYGREKTIIEFPAYHKTQVLGAPKIEGKPCKSGKRRYKSLDPRRRKKWAIEKALEILNSRGEVEILEKMASKKKMDDLADVICQLNAFKYLYLDGKQF